MARYFEDTRGRAIAVTALGFTAAEAALPVAAVAAIGEFGWRHAYLGAAALQLLVFFPFLQWLLPPSKAAWRLPSSPGSTQTF